MTGPKIGNGAVTPPKFAVQPYLQATHTGGTNEVIPTVGFPLPWTVDHDTSGMDTSVHHNVFTATVAGIYHLIAVVTWAADTDGQQGGYEILVLHSGPSGGAYFGQAPDSNGAGATVGVSTDMTVAVGDTIQVELIRTNPLCGGPPVPVCAQTFGSGQHASYLVMNWVGNAP